MSDLGPAVDRSRRRAAVPVQHADENADRRYRSASARRCRLRTGSAPSWRRSRAKGNAAAPSPLILRCCLQKAVALMARNWMEQDPTSATLAFRSEVWSAMEAIERAVNSGTPYSVAGSATRVKDYRRSFLGAVSRLDGLRTHRLLSAAAGASRLPFAAEPGAQRHRGRGGARLFRRPAFLPGVQALQGHDAVGLSQTSTTCSAPTRGRPPSRPSRRAACRRSADHRRAGRARRCRRADGRGRDAAVPSGCRPGRSRAHSPAAATAQSDALRPQRAEQRRLEQRGMVRSQLELRHVDRQRLDPHPGSFRPRFCRQRLDHLDLFTGEMAAHQHHGSARRSRSGAPASRAAAA